MQTNFEDKASGSQKSESKANPSAFLKTGEGKTKSNAIEIPSISLPKGGGAIKGIDEKFSINAVNGTASFSIPLPFSRARGALPALSLSYSSGEGNGIFGLGWSLTLSSIKRKLDKGLPQYLDAIDSDTYLFSEAEDLVPEFKKENDGSFSIDVNGDYVINEKDSPEGFFKIRFYKPRIEGLFARIERWTENITGIIKWRVITRDNITTLFGWTNNSVIADPKDNNKIFEWLPEFVFDDKGNCSQYIYKKEDDIGYNTSLLHNKNRFESGNITYVNLYLERILYGNKNPYKKFKDAFPVDTDYMFQTVFDYGTLKNIDPVTKINDWDFRTDSFSDYKSGFEIRTTRLCKRVLFFHHFTGPNEYDGLVKSVNFDYDTASEKDFTFLKSITVCGYIKKADGTYTSKKFPATEFEYQKHEWNKDVINISAEDLVHAPAGLDEQQYQFTDLFNEGLSGILTEQANGWYYKHNLGEGKFEQAKIVTPKPTFVGLHRQLQLADLDADGGKQLVSYGSEPKGYFELDDDNEWQGFRNFQSLPNIDFRDANTRMLDLNGDGKPEVLISEDTVFAWYPSKGRNGFAQVQKTTKSFNEEAGPHIVFADQKQTIFLADMSGDGLTDIVRIRNGEVCYWPNLGYGKFGTKVAMDNAPLFDYPDYYNPTYLRLADIDGSGTTDIIYLGKNKFTCWLNLSGNSFRALPFEIESVPEINSQSKITVTDLLGNGVACIVWSSLLSKDTQSSLRYIDLMNSRKPHIMVSYKNNLGKEVSLEYKPSTKFYIEDKFAGKPWVTKLHFPVHCVSKTIAEDKITGHKFTSSYKYHHGYYDHSEKEYRGFGMVEQTDAETFESWAKSGASNVSNAELHQEPVVTKQWFHTGAFLRDDKILTQFSHEYWYEELKRWGFPGTHHEKLLDDAKINPAKGISQTLVDNLSAEEYQQALRTCKSMPLRTEVFAYDASRFGNTTSAKKKELTPYTVTSHSCVIELLQPKGKNKHAIFRVNERESLMYGYERDTEDPRTTHSLNIQLDEHGNLLESAAIVYPRRIADGSLPPQTQAAQGETSIIYTVNKFTNDVFDDNTNRQCLPAEVKNFQLKGVVKPGDYYALKDFENILTNSNEVFYHQDNKPVASGKAQRRLFEHIKFLYYKNDLTASLPLYSLESKAIEFENYQLTYTPELLSDIFGLKVNSALMVKGKFAHSKDENSLDDNDWWVRSGTLQYIEGVETAIEAQNRFFMPISYTEPFGATTKVKYYSTYFLMVEETEDALLNKGTALSFNFRTIAPRRLKDANDNISEVLTDELGMIKAMAFFGKGNQADDLIGLKEETDTDEKTLTQHFFSPPAARQNVTDSVSLVNTATQLMQNATARFVYDLDVYKNTGKPVIAASIIRENHARKEDGSLNPASRLQLSFEYSSGIGNVTMKKVQAKPGMAKRVELLPNNFIILDDVDTTPFLRWIGTGKTILNNKGNAVKQYEPYFSISNKYEDQKELVEAGVTPILYYDALGRMIRTDMPDGSFSKMEFNSWKQIASDANDTVLESEWYQKRSDNNRPDFITDPKEQQAAAKALLHTATPCQLHLDTLGRPVLSIDHNKNITTNADEYYPTIVDLDVQGNMRSVTDARGNVVMEHKYDMLGNKVYQLGMDAGERFLLQNVVGNPLLSWDKRNLEFSFEYDILHRPTIKKIKGGDGLNPFEPNPLDNIYEKIIYGEGLPGDKANNLRTRAVIVYDTAGKNEFLRFDFIGNQRITKRTFTQKYKEIVNWVGPNPDAKLDLTEHFTTSLEYDAIGRIIKQVAPDNPINSVFLPQYNEAGLLDKVQVMQNGNTEWFVKNIDYNARGQRKTIIYGNNVNAKYSYDVESLRLSRLETKRQNNDPLQDLYYTYDPVGNITHVEDKNIPDVFFNNHKITGTSVYTYDALYRLVKAIGREHAGQLNFGLEDNWNDFPFLKQYSPTDSMAWRIYTQNYNYDHVGNILRMQHIADGGNWTRDYTYDAANNRLQKTIVGTDVNTFNYGYPHQPQNGFITALPHLQVMNWNFKEELQAVAKQNVVNGTPETTFYVYDGDGHRVRKITEKEAGPGIVNPAKRSQRIYVGGIELYREYDNTNTKNLERLSYHVMDDKNRIAMIETLKMEGGKNVNEILVRYQFSGHLGSSNIETDGSPNGRVISYEEYHPFGTTSYQAIDKDIKTAAKRYRYTGMERDDESGLEYHAARYYLPWLGRWLNSDPYGIADGLNIYVYAHNKPIIATDTNGKWIFVVAIIVGVVAGVLTSSPANAPTNSETKLEPRVSELRVAANVTMGVTAVVTAPAIIAHPVRAVATMAVMHPVMTEGHRVANQIDPSGNASAALDITVSVAGGALMSRARPLVTVEPEPNFTPTRPPASFPRIGPANDNALAAANDNAIPQIGPPRPVEVPVEEPLQATGTDPRPVIRSGGSSNRPVASGGRRGRGGEEGEGEEMVNPRNRATPDRRVRTRDERDANTSSAQDVNLRGFFFRNIANMLTRAGREVPRDLNKLWERFSQFTRQHEEGHFHMNEREAMNKLEEFLSSEE